MAYLTLAYMDDDGLPAQKDVPTYQQNKSEDRETTVRRFQTHDTDSTVHTILHAHLPGGCGELHWKTENMLGVGQVVRETTEFKTAEVKVTRAGEEMITVGIEKAFENVGGLAVVDKQAIQATARSFVP